MRIHRVMVSSESEGVATLPGKKSAIACAAGGAFRLRQLVLAVPTAR
jgi:hypothetical protein